jgi:rhomboid protease GluP
MNSENPQTDNRYVRVQFPIVDPTITYVLIGILDLIHLFLLNLSEREMIDYYIRFSNNAGQVEAGEYYRLFTSMFLHANFTHLIFNCLALYSFGRDVEGLFGHLRFALIYFLGGLAGSVTSFVFTQGNSIGASGAVFAIFGAMVAYFYQNRVLYGPQVTRQRLTSLGMLAFINLAIGLVSAVPGSSVRIDNAAHIGGALGGILLAYYMTPIFRPEVNLEEGYVVPQMVDTRTPAQWAIFPAIFAVMLAIIVGITA